MTEEEWLTCTDPKRLMVCLEGRSGVVTSIVRFLRRRNDPKPRLANERQMRLFWCAYCRRVAVLLDDRMRQAVAMSERYADGEADDIEMQEVAAAAVMAAESLLAQETGLSLPVANQPPVGRARFLILAGQA